MSLVLMQSYEPRTIPMPKKKKKQKTKKRKEKEKEKERDKEKGKKEKKEEEEETFLNNEIFYLCDIRSLRFKPPTYFYHKKH